MLNTTKRLFFCLLLSGSFSVQALDWECREMDNFIDSMYEIADLLQSEPYIDDDPQFERDVDDILDFLTELAYEAGSANLSKSVRRLSAIWEKEEWSNRDYTNFRSALDSTNQTLDRLYKQNCSATSNSNSRPGQPTGGGGGNRGSALNNYAALAIDSNHGSRYGIAYNFGSESAAKRSAVNQCGRGCTAVLWFRGGCGAYATDRTSGSSIYGWSTSNSANQAKNEAVRNCINRGGNRCGVRVWGCNDN